jgi:hypothetical protein
MAAVKITSVSGRNKMVSGPYDVFVLDDRHNICPALPFPAKNIFLSDIGDKVGETAFSAAMAKLFFYLSSSHKTTFFTYCQALHAFKDY